MNIGERIKQRRIELNLSQDELAKKCGYKSRSSIQKIETARRLPLPKVEFMAAALEMTPMALMGWDDEPITMDFEEGSDFQHIKMYKNLLDEDKETVNRVIESLYNNKKVSE